MSDFEKCITKTLRYEGVSSSSEGYVDHPNDKGGATKYGISYAFVKDTGDIDFFDMNDDNIIDKRDIQQLTFDKAVEAYKKYFWDVFSLDDIEENDKAFLVFDAAVNHGVKGAAKLTQRALNACGFSLVVDGIYGRKTKAALQECSKDDFVRAFQEKRTALYKAIVNKNPSQEVFLAGWLNRVSWTSRDLEYV
jgi:lysozyme family protein